MKKGFSILPLIWFLLMLTSASLVLARFTYQRKLALKNAIILEKKLHLQHQLDNH